MLPVDRPVEIGPGAENLEIEYTGLHWRRPRQMRFRYRLVGLDDDWIEAGTRRTAYYPYLPPGRYTFEVTADNGEGVWSREGKSLEIVVRPPYYQRWWFVGLLVAGAVVAVWQVYRWRMRQMERAQAVQAEFSRRLITSQESERRRIASELHDGLGQSLVLIRNWALLGSAQIAEGEPGREDFDEISTTASQAIGEVRQIAYNLGPYHLDRLGLANSIREMVNRVGQASPMRFSVEIDSLDGALSREAGIMLYRIVQEAINNIVKHSAATESRIAIRRENGRVRLTVSDNGRGFEVHKTGVVEGQAGFGLAGMSERVRLLGGTLAIHSSPGQGATIEVTLDAGAVSEQEKNGAEG